MNPCGVGVSDNIVTSFEKAYDADNVSIYGGIVAFNRTLDSKLAHAILDKKVFLEIIIAPLITDEALELLSKKKNCRIMEVNMDKEFNDKNQAITVNGGLLYQELDLSLFNENDLEVVTNKKPTEKEMKDLIFAFTCVKHVKSNAIVVAKDLTTCGIGAGQMNRVGSARIALEAAKEKNITNMVLASDAFFPFEDTVELASKYGITAIIQPGGSIRDIDSINKANELGISMVFTKMRHFKH